jgi:hypothetical protein
MMPVQGRWYEFTHERILTLEGDLAGVYYIANKDKLVIYIGKSERNIRGRLLTHLDSRCIKINGGIYFRYVLANGDDPKYMETLAIMLHDKKYHQWPICVRKRYLLYEY